MPDQSRPRRSALYLPGSTPRALGKARGRVADVLILDLTDAARANERAILDGVLNALCEVFGPPAGEFETARRRFAAFEDAAAADQGVSVFGGRVVENQHAASARRVLAQAEAIRAQEAELA